MQAFFMLRVYSDRIIISEAEVRLMYRKRVSGRRNRTGHTRMGRRRQRRRLAVICCLMAFMLGFLSGKTVTLAIMDHEGRNAGVRAAAGTDSGNMDPDGDNWGETDENGNGWNLVLVNRDHPLPSDFTTSLASLGEGHQVDQRIASDLRKMLEDGKRAGCDILIVSSFRTMEQQTRLYERKVEQMRSQGYSQERAVEEAGKIVAPPGTSEHQLGLAVDLADAGYTTLDERQEQTAGYQWLVRHCAEYGFILRYPGDKTEITGIIYEPWHFRYVGKEAAAEIMEREICLEEYLSQ